MHKNARSICHGILIETMARLSALRQKAMGLPDQSQIEAVIEAIGYFAESLPTMKHPRQLVEFCGRALVDIQHEIVAAEYGYESPEADAEFDAGETKLNRLIRHLHNDGSLDGWYTIWDRAS